MAGLTALGPMVLQDAQTTGLGRFLLFEGKAQGCSVAISGTGTTSGGVITIEECYFNPTVTPGGYTGTWSSLQAVNASDVTGGKQVVVHIAGNVWAIRARISSDITGGGTISAFAWGL